MVAYSCSSSHSLYLYPVIAFFFFYVEGFIVNGGVEITDPHTSDSQETMETCIGCDAKDEIQS